MAGTVREATLQTPTARARLKRGRQPHWRALVPGKIHLGYQRWPEDHAGRWLLRRRVAGRYTTATLGRADEGNGAGLSYEQAVARAQPTVGAAQQPMRLTVRKAMALYVDYLAAQGKRTSDVVSRTVVHILPQLGELEVSRLTPATLRQWLAAMARTHALMRSAAGGRLNVRVHNPDDEEAVRARRASANRVLAMLKAALNHCYDEQLVNDNSAWGRRVRPFPNAKAARVRYLTVDEAQRLLNGCPPALRALVRGALETGARYGELTRLQCADFNPHSGTVHIRKSKSGKGRHVVLTEQGVAFFTSLCVGRPALDFAFTHATGRPWRNTDQQYPLRDANVAARIAPPITFHGLRHTWASLAVMNGVPLQIVAQNLGHVDTTMCQRHYAHLAPSYVADAIRAGAPRYGPVPPTNVKPLRPKKS
jgi:integrase